MWPWLASFAAGGLTVVAWRLVTSVETLTAALAVTYGCVLAVIVAVHRTSRRRAIFGGIAATAVAGTLIAAFEATALAGVDYRLIFRTRTLSLAHDPQNIVDEELIFRRPPGARLTGTTTGNLAFLFDTGAAIDYPYDVRYDANGFRNSVDHTSADVVVLGDSFMEAPLVAEAGTVAGQLAARRHQVVANLGMSAYGPQQAVATYRRYGRVLSPSVVVLVFFEGNDLTDVDTYRRFLAEGPAARHSWYQRSFSRNFLVGLYQASGRPRPSGAHLAALVPTTRGRERVYFMYPGEPLTPAQSNALTVVKASLGELFGMTSASSAHLVVAFAPTKFRALAPFVEATPGSLVGSWSLNDLPERMRRLVAEVSPTITYVDLTPALAATAAAGSLPYFRDDSHWNAAGHAAAADAIAAALDHD